MPAFDGTLSLDPSRFAYSSPGGPQQCYAYPAWAFHATKPPVRVGTAEEFKALGEGWSSTYIKRDYPKAKWNQETGEYRAVANPDEESKLEGNWGDKPPEKPPKPAPPHDRTLQEVIESAAHPAATAAATNVKTAAAAKEKEEEERKKR